MLLAGSALMFAAMVIVGVIVAEFRHDWEHHAVAGEKSLFSLLSVLCPSNYTDNLYNTCRLGCSWYVLSSNALLHSPHSLSEKETS